MKARRVLDDAVKVLKASTAIDHWQRGRERLEAEDLLWHVVGREPDPSDDISAEQRRMFDRLVERRIDGRADPVHQGLHGVPGSRPPGATRGVRPSRCLRVPRGAGVAAAPGPRGPRARRPGDRRRDDRAGCRERGPEGDRDRDGCLGRGGRARAREREAPWSARAIRHGATCSAGSRGSWPAPSTSSRCIRRTCRCASSSDLPEEIREWEPEHTLTDRSHDGLGLITRTAREAPAWLSPDGWLLLEVSPDRVLDVKRVLRARGVPRRPEHEGRPAAR